VLAGLRLVIDSHPESRPDSRPGGWPYGRPIPMSELRVMLGVTRGVRLERVAQVLHDRGSAAALRQSGSSILGGHRRFPRCQSAGVPGAEMQQFEG
jgi:hypothetical protein